MWNYEADKNLGLYFDYEYDTSVTPARQKGVKLRKIRLLNAYIGYTPDILFFVSVLKHFLSRNDFIEAEKIFIHNTKERTLNHSVAGKLKAFWTEKYLIRFKKINENSKQYLEIATLEMFWNTSDEHIPEEYRNTDISMNFEQQKVRIPVLKAQWYLEILGKVNYNWL